MLEGSIVEFTHRGYFNLDEANSLIGVLNRITKKHSEKVNQLITQLESTSIDNREVTSRLEDLVGQEIEQWNTKVRKLGAVPKGMWLVDMDSGDGFYCWKFPEVEINYWHDYKSGFGSRIALSQLGMQNSFENNFRVSKKNDSYK